MLLPLLPSLPSGVDFESLDCEWHRMIWRPKKLNFLTNGIKPVFRGLHSGPSSFSTSFDKPATAGWGPHNCLAHTCALQIHERIHHNRDSP